jgi:riboflavin kinase / FMN adenylyltransferase
VTKLIRGLYNIIAQNQGGVVTIGNFDGVHLGHKALIEKVKNNAKNLQVPSIVITFEPQPMEFFAPEKKIARLTRWREKFAALAETEIDAVLLLSFNRELASWRADEFIKRVLVDRLAVKQVIVGDDFRFGYQREGDFSFLQKKGEESGFSVDNMPSVIMNHDRVSSTRIRQALTAGNLDIAAQLLGRPYTMMGRVVHGDKLGRQLGFPTANIYLHRAVTPVHGIHIVRMHGIDKNPLAGVANIGTRPTIGGTRSLLEVYLFNFDRDIYDRQVCVEFCKKIRDEEHFDNLELLKNAIADDAAIARDYFKGRGEL